MVFGRRCAPALPSRPGGRGPVPVPVRFACLFYPIPPPPSTKKVKIFTRAAAIGLGTSLFIEVAQYFLMRSTDIDDVILNTLGALCGWWMYLLLRQACPQSTQKFIVSQRSQP